ncbi:leucine Rich repeat-containing domain protein [Ostertagia ostertagi]
MLVPPKRCRFLVCGSAPQLGIAISHYSLLNKVSSNPFLTTTSCCFQAKCDELPPNLENGIRKAMAFPLSAGRGVTQVIDRCEVAKESGFLDLSSCSLMYIADAIYLVLKGFEITRVSLRNNALKKFPKKIINKFPNLTIFNIEGNEITEFPQEFEELTSMKGLNAANNKLTSVPEGIFNMKHLAILDLSGNLIEDVDADRLYSSCPSLIQLNVAGNPMKEEAKLRLSTSSLKPAKIILKLD